MTQHKKKYSPTRPLLLLIVGLAGLGVSVWLLLAGVDVRLLNPKGAIAEQQLWLMIFSVLLILAIAVPTLIILYSFAWKYRESNTRAAYDPISRTSKLSVASMWILPSVFMIVLALVMWPATHRLEPKKTIATDGKPPLTVQVVAMRWKWLFIYPEQNIATVNYVHIPVDRSIRFQLTADEVSMSSFWIPHLGGQLYAMTGHVNTLNLIANQPGEYPGSSAEINGAGFAGMKFTAHADSGEDFELWVQSMKTSSNVLSETEYDKLLKPSENHSKAFYSATMPGLYDKLLMKYTGAQENKTKQHGSGH